MSSNQYSLLGNSILPVDIVLLPEWWNKNEGITFDQDFFYHPLKRVEVEQQKEKVLYDRWGKYGLGEYRKETRPEIGAVHLAAGYLLPEMLGCEVNYSENHPPQVLAAHKELENVSVEDAFKSETFNKVLKLTNALKRKYSRVTGDINWGGILNIAMDLRGESIFVDMMMSPDETKAYFTSIASVIEKFTNFLETETGSTSVSVNRGVRHLQKPVLLHSECSHTMISAEDYEEFLLPYDIAWSQKRPYGIHYCGADPHRMAASFAKIPQLDFLDVGWGGDVKVLRDYLPNTFLNIRYSPVELARQSKEEIKKTIVSLVKDSGNPLLTGVCCINIDDSVSDDKIDTIFETVEELRKE
ncbi:MAG: uroporphyrinogen decarboxylase family protein [Paludibacter sp.]|nr:uroporphyrinogen decarboxylase family protein [Paludibacter sp.]